MSLFGHEVDLSVLLGVEDHADDDFAVAGLPDCIDREAHERISFAEVLALLDEAGKALALHLARIDADMHDALDARIGREDDAVIRMADRRDDAVERCPQIVLFRPDAAALAQHAGKQRSISGCQGAAKLEICGSSLLTNP